MTKGNNTIVLRTKWRMIKYQDPSQEFYIAQTKVPTTLLQRAPATVALQSACLDFIKWGLNPPGVGGRVQPKNSAPWPGIALLVSMEGILFEGDLPDVTMKIQDKYQDTGIKMLSPVRGWCCPSNIWPAVTLIKHLRLVVKAGLDDIFRRLAKEGDYLWPAKDLDYKIWSLQYNQWWGHMKQGVVVGYTKLTSEAGTFSREVAQNICLKTEAGESLNLMMPVERGVFG